MPGLELPGEFLRHAVLDTVVPHAPSLDIEQALTSALEDGADDLPSVLSAIPQRSLLFYGMLYLTSQLVSVSYLSVTVQMNISPFALC